MNIFLWFNCFEFYFFLFSCSRKSEVFSCDSQANLFAVQHLTSNQSISRDSLAKLPSEYQFAVFRSRTNANRLRIFREKVKLILSSVEELSIEERSVFMFLKDRVPEDV